MSIVDKTLQRLESANASSAEGAAQTPHHITDDLLYVAGGARRRRSPLLLWLLVGLVLVAAAGYWLLERATPVAGPDAAPSATATGAAVTAPTTLAQGVSAAPTEPEALAAMAAPEAAATAALAAPDAAAAAPAAGAAVAATPAPVAAIGAPAEAPTPLAPTAVAAAAPANSATQPAMAAAPAPAPAVVAAPLWLDAGWQVALDRGVVQAVPVWERGLLTLPDEEQLIVGHAFLDRHGMNSALAQREPHWAAFAVREAGAAHTDGAPLFRVAVWVPPGAAPDLQQQVAQRFGRADRMRAATLKRRVQRVAAAPAAPAAPAGAAAATAAIATAALANAQAAQAQPGVARPVATAPASTPAANDTRMAPAPAAATAPASPAPPAPTVIALPLPPASAVQPAAAAPAPTSPVPLAANAAPAAPAATAPVPASRAWEARASEVRELLRQGAFALVADRAEPLTRDFPDRWEPWFWLGTSALALGRLPQAEQALDRALALNPNVEQVLVQRAVAAQERGDHSTAVRFLQQAALLAPRVPEVHLNLGFSFEALGRTGEAERSFITFLTLTEGNPAYAVQRQHIEARFVRR